MTDAIQIRDHMEVIGSDGEHVGRVDRIMGAEIELAKLDLQGGLKHHRIPLSWVDYVDEDKVRLSVTRDEAKAAWRDKH
jgi:hypothetical protein